MKSIKSYPSQFSQSEADVSGYNGNIENIEKEGVMGDVATLIVKDVKLHIPCKNLAPTEHKHPRLCKPSHKAIIHMHRNIAGADIKLQLWQCTHLQANLTHMSNESYRMRRAYSRANRDD